MKFLFVIQGEGRGHFSQALAMKEILDRHDHKVVHVVVGTSAQRKIPSYFIQDIKVNITEIESPNFAKSKDQKGVNLWKTAWLNRNINKFWQGSIGMLKQLIDRHQPDRIINFYEPLLGLAYLKYRMKVPYITIGHQYLHQHPEFPETLGFAAQKRFLKWLNQISSFGCHKKLALSFKQMDDDTNQKIFVTPPLLRSQILNMSSTEEGHILGYMLNKGLAENVITWHRENQDVKAVFFWDGDTKKENENLVFEGLNADKFMRTMASSVGVMTTAGFESLCEAKYLGKPLVFMPTPNHYEQLCNAVDAEFCGIGKHILNYDPQLLLDYISSHNQEDNLWFKDWVTQAESIFISHLIN